MAAAALTPRVRIMAICDEVTASESEEGVFTLQGVRQHLSAGSFPAGPFDVAASPLPLARGRPFFDRQPRSYGNIERPCPFLPPLG